MHNIISQQSTATLQALGVKITELTELIIVLSTLRDPICDKDLTELSAKDQSLDENNAFLGMLILSDLVSL